MGDAGGSVDPVQLIRHKVGCEGVFAHGPYDEAAGGFVNILYIILF